MMMETKLRSFTVDNLAKYNKFAEIQRTRGKKTGERLNELIEKEVKEADPQYIDKSAARLPESPDIIIPNPFLYDQMKSLPLWEEYLKTLTKKDHAQVYLHILALKSITYSFEDFVDRK